MSYFFTGDIGLPIPRDIRGGLGRLVRGQRQGRLAAKAPSLDTGKRCHPALYLIYKYIGVRPSVFCSYP